MAIAVLAAGFLVVLGLGFALGRAALLDNELLRARLAQELADWTGGTVKLTGPVKISYLPTMTFDVEHVAVRDTAKLPSIDHIESKRLRIELAFWSLISGNLDIGKLSLTEPRVGLTPDPWQTGGDHGQTLIRALQSAPFSEISIERGNVTFAGKVEKEQISNLDMDVELTAKGAASARGRFTWRNQPLEFSLSSETPVVVANTAKSPLELSVTGPLISGRITGNARIADGAQLAGTLELDIPDLRQFVNWVGLLVPEGQGLGKFTASGSVNWAGQKIAVDNGSFELDGNRALGALALQFGTPRPALEGTLALKELSVSQYLHWSKTSDDGQKPGLQKSTNLTFPLLHHFDVDLRVSATQLQAKPLVIGETAITVTVKSGVLAAEFAILDVCGGKGDGRLELNAAKTRPRMQLSAALDNLTPESCIELFLAKSPVQGAKSKLSLNLSSEGGDNQEFLARLAGKLVLSMQAGQISIDPLKVVSAAKKGTLRGWKAILGGQRNFETLSAEFLLDSGNARSDKFEVVSGRTTVTGRGTIDIAMRKMHWRIKVADRAFGEASRFGNFVAELVDSLIVQGPLTEPILRLERKSARRESPASGWAARVFLGAMH